MQLQENQCNDFVSNLVSFYVLFTQFIRDKLKILKMQHINYIVKIRKREANFELTQQWSSGECRAQFENC